MEKRNDNFKLELIKERVRERKTMSPESQNVSRVTVGNKKLKGSYFGLRFGLSADYRLMRRSVD